MRRHRGGDRYATLIVDLTSDVSSPPTDGAISYALRCEEPHNLSALGQVVPGTSALHLGNAPERWLDPLRRGLPPPNNSVPWITVD